jgi:pyruvate dehydrogenase complex dehydrogenase (E1) component
MNMPTPLGGSELRALLHAVPGDEDAAETREWLDALASLVQASGPERARFVLDALQEASSMSARGAVLLLARWREGQFSWT